LAQNNLGSIYGEGRGVTRDYQTAIEWYRKAANQGNAEAQYNLGSVYKTLQDNIHAHMWWNIAASKGYKEAASNLDTVEREMTAEEINKSQKLARICLAKDYQHCN
jgi:TPR repeat protein